MKENSDKFENVPSLVKFQEFVGGAGGRFFWTSLSSMEEGPAPPENAVEVCIRVELTYVFVVNSLHFHSR